MSISQNFPEEGPTLNLNFAGSKTLDPRITFSRTTTGTYMDDSGLIVTAPADAPRFDHRYVNGEIESLGLLVEESSSNLITYSEDFQDTSWSKFNISITGTSSVSPDGSANATEFTPSSANSRVNVDLTTSADGDHTFSVFAKAGTGQFVTLRSPGYGTDTTIGFDLVGGTAQSGGTITDFGNGWYRCSMTFDTNGDQVGQPSIYLATTLGGYSGDVGETFYLWGAQLEQKTFPTSYIPTSGGTATRNPDSVTMTGDNFSNWYNQTEGTLFTRYKTIGDKSNQMVAQIRSTDGNNRVEIRAQATGSSQFRVEVIDEGATQQQEFGITPSGYTVNNYHKITLGYKENDFASTINGTLYTDNSGTVGSCDYMMIGAANYGDNGDLNGYISQLTYYPTRLTNAQLQNLTK